MSTTEPKGLGQERQEEQEARTSNRRVLTGRVVSDKMQKTVVVEVERKVLHAKYQKYVSQRRRFKAHDEDNACKMDDIVTIQESRPLSRTKRWVVIGRRAAGA